MHDRFHGPHEFNKVVLVRTEPLTNFRSWITCKLKGRREEREQFFSNIANVTASVSLDMHMKYNRNFNCALK